MYFDLGAKLKVDSENREISKCALDQKYLDQKLWMTTFREGIMKSVSLQKESKF